MGHFKEPIDAWMRPNEDPEHDAEYHIEQGRHWHQPGFPRQICFDVSTIWLECTHLQCSVPLVGRLVYGTFRLSTRQMS